MTTLPNDPATTTTTKAPSNNNNKEEPPIKVVFIHLDLGIGGAEQLVLSLASASQQLGHDVEIMTSHCAQDHCFSQVKKPNGRLSNNVHVWGEWIPSNLLGKATALCSTLRMLYLAYWTARRISSQTNNENHVVVLDVLPTPIPFLIYWWNIPSVLFYCHFPDKLLTRDTVNGEPTEAMRRRIPLFHWYRSFLDSLEESTMAHADVLVVNSKFTQSQVTRVFTTLEEKPMRVLYPALDTSRFDKDANHHDDSTGAARPIVSLNRFERKKNIELLLQAYAELRDKLERQQQQNKLPPLVIAGGYDVKNVENVEYMGELRTLAQELSLFSSPANISFRPSVSDEERSTLMRTALCVVYTPHLEHFGIVPLEAMYAGRPVVAVNSGGPMETVVDGTTGFLCEATPGAFGQALWELVTNPKRATEMGNAGRAHVQEKFGVDAFQQEWNVLIEETINQGKQRRRAQSGGRPPYLLTNGFFYLVEAALVFLVVIVLTWIFRMMGYSCLRDVFYHQEL